LTASRRELRPQALAWLDVLADAFAPDRSVPLDPPSRRHAGMTSVGR
jgi:hypothetical protein